MPGDKIFLDTNVLIYAYDVSAGKKHDRAKAIMIDLWNSGQGILSTQVLEEFFHRSAGCPKGRSLLVTI